MAAKAANYLFEKLQKSNQVVLANAIGRQLFDLENCLICKEFCLKLDAFALHVEQKHKHQFAKEQQNGEAEALSTCKYKLIPDFEQITTEHVAEQADEIEHEECAHESKDILSYKDPLLQQKTVKSSQIQSELEQKDIESNDDDCAVYSEDDTWATDTSDELHLEYNNDIHPHNKKVFLVFLQQWQQYPVLWKNAEKQNEALQELTAGINQQASLNLTAEQVQTAMTVARYKFKHKLREQRKGRPDATVEWHLEALRFLEAGINIRKRCKRGERIAQERNVLPLQGLTREQNLQLIKIYEKFPCLWDMLFIGYRFKHKRQDALEQMLQTIETEMGIKVSSTDLQKKLYRIRYACTQQKYKQLQCDKQGQQFKSDCSFYQHYSFLNDSVGPFKCAECAHIFYGVDQYKMHKSKHDGSFPFHCPTCKRGFMKVGNCIVHIRRHTRDFTFPCKECDRNFATSTELSVHKRSHTREKPYCCEICGQTFRTWTFLDTHMRRHQKRAKYKCAQCNKEFYESNKWHEHLNAHQNVRDKICNVCGKSFTGRKYLRQHMLLHGEEKRFVCRICQKQFAQHAGLSAHMKSHGTSLSSLHMS